MQFYSSNVHCTHIMGVQSVHENVICLHTTFMCVLVIFRTIQLSISFLQCARPTTSKRHLTNNCLETTKKRHTIWVKRKKREHARNVNNDNRALFRKSSKAFSAFSIKDPFEQYNLFDLDNFQFQHKISIPYGIHNWFTIKMEKKKQHTHCNTIRNYWNMLTPTECCLEFFSLSFSFHSLQFSLMCDIVTHNTRSIDI